MSPRSGSTLLTAASVVGHGLLLALVYAGVGQAEARPAPRAQRVEIAFLEPPPPPPPEKPPVVPPQAARAVAARPRPAARARQVPLPKADATPAPDQEVVPEEPVVEETPEPAPPGPPAPPVAVPAPIKETLVEAREGANYKHNPRPAFPPIAIDRGWEGTVLLRVLVSPDGRAERIVVATSSGRAILDEAAVATVKGWLFEPARRGAARVAGWVSTPIVFRLQ